MSLGTLTARVALDTSPLSAGVKAAAMGFGLVAAGAAAAIYKVGSAYESSLNTFQAVSSASAEQMKQVGAEAKKLGADMTLPATSAADAAKAMTELAKSGLSVDEALKAAKGTLQLAAAAGVDEAKAAEITANALNAFGLKGSEAGRVADILAASANASSAEITDMADALQMSGAVAAAANIPIEDLAAALGELANKGIKGSDAGTSVKQMLLALEGPSKIAAGVMKQYGINIYDAAGKMKPLRDIIANVSGALGGLTDAQRNAALATIFGSDAVRAANVVLLGGVDAFDQMKGAVTKNGAAAEVAAAKTKGLKGAFEGLKSQLEGVAISIYEKVAPGIERFVRSVAEGIPKAIETLKLGAKAFRAAFSGEGITSDGFVGIMERLGVAARGFVDWFKANWPQIKAIGESALNAVKAGAEALVPVFKVAVEVVKDLVEKAPALKPILDGIADAFGAIGRFIDEHLEGFKQLAEIVGVVMVARFAALKAQLVITFAASVIEGIVAFGTATAGAATATEGLTGAAALAAAPVGAVVVAGAAALVTAVVLARTIIDHNGIAEKMAGGFIALERSIPIVGGALADLDSKVFGVTTKVGEAARATDALQGALLDYARGKYNAEVTIDASQAFRTIDQLRNDLALLNTQISDKDLGAGPGGGRGAARNEVEGEIASRTGPGPGAGAQLDQYAAGGLIARAAGGLRRAAGGLRRAAGGLAMMAPGGGRPHGPTLVSEGGYDEWVITPDPLYRMRNLGLLGQANQALGGGSSAGPAPVDYQALAAALAPMLAAAVAANPIRAVVSTSDIAYGLNQYRQR